MNKAVIFFMPAVLGVIGCIGRIEPATTSYDTRKYNIGIGPGGVAYSYYDDWAKGDAFGDDWATVKIFVAVYNQENALSFCNSLLEKYYGNKEDMSGWKEVTESFVHLTSDLSDCEARLERVSRRIYEIEGQADKRGKMLRAVEQARIDIAKIRDVIPAFETRMNAVWQEKETELKRRRNEIDSLGEAGERHLTYSDADVRVELTDLFVRRERVVRSVIATFNVKLRLTVVSNSRIVRPRTGYLYSSEEAYSSSRNPNVIIVNPRVGEVSRGVALKDNFGNSFGLNSIRPFCSGGETDTGLKPEESKTFTVCFTDEPLKKTESLTVTVSEGTFGNVKSFELTIPKTLINIALDDKHSMFFPATQSAASESRGN